MAFDSVISIGGQSLVDGLWRILQPALQSLTNPLPFTVPGMTNAWVRIRNITPSMSSASASGLELIVDLEARGDILLTASVRAGTVHLALPNGNITIPMPAAPGSLNLPTSDIEVTLPNMTGTASLPVGGTGPITLNPAAPGHMRLPSGGTFQLPNLSGTLNFIGTPGDVGLPLPAVVPLAIDLTPTSPMRITASLVLRAHSPIDDASAFGLLLELDLPVFGGLPTTLPDATNIVSAINSGLGQLLPQLGVPMPLLPGVVPTPEDISSIATDIAGEARGAIHDVLKNALSGLTARTGRLIFPAPAIGSPCDVALLPTEAQAQVTSSTTTGLVLQVGFARTGVSAMPWTFPAFTPSGIADVKVDIGNDYLLELLCCLIEKLPNFTFRAAATPTTAEAGRTCCGWTGVTLELWPLVFSGTLSLCIVGSPGAPKTVELVGSFTQTNPLGIIIVRFTQTLALHLDDAAAVTGLRLASVTPEVPYVTFDLHGLLSATLLLAGLLTLHVPAIPILLALIPILLLNFVCDQLRAVVETLLSRAHALTSPVAVPPGVFEAFGRFVPASIVIDDLTAHGVLATPTSPWALLPITGKLPRYPDPKWGNQHSLTHGTASDGKDSQGPQ